MNLRSFRRAAAAAVACAALATSCSSGGSTESSGTTTERATGSAVEGEVTVLAASSLTEVFSDIAAAFEAEHPGAHVRLSFEASPTLVAQVQEGAPADVVATADDLTMGKLTGSGDVDAPRTFARNKLAIAVARGNPEEIEGLDDLSRDGLVVVLCDSSVPCGRLADEALQKAGASVHPASREQNVKATLTKVAAGEADAAIVYATDTAAAGDVTGVEIPDAENVTTRLPIATVRQAANRDAARAFADFVLSDAGRRILTGAGFLEP